MKTKNPEVENAYKCVACKMSDKLPLGNVINSDAEMYFWSNRLMFCCPFFNKQ